MQITPAIRNSPHTVCHKSTPYKTPSDGLLFHSRLQLQVLNKYRSRTDAWHKAAKHCRNRHMSVCFKAELLHRWVLIQKNASDDDGSRTSGKNYTKIQKILYRIKTLSEKTVQMLWLGRYPHNFVPYLSLKECILVPSESLIDSESENKNF